MADKTFLTQADFVSWRRQPTTQLVYDAMQKVREHWADMLVGGMTLQENQDIRETAKVVGIIYGLDQFLTFEVED